MASKKKALLAKKKEEAKAKERKRLLYGKTFLRRSLKIFIPLGIERFEDVRLKEIGATPPDVQHVEDRLSQISLKKQINYYTLKARLSVNKETEHFNKTGKIWCMIVAAVPGVGEKVVFMCYFKRKKGVEKKFIPLMEALNFELSNRPSDSKGVFMNLVELSPRNTVWRSVHYDKNKEEIPMFSNLPKHLANDIAKMKQQWKYYRDVVRPRKGIVQEESEIRKTWEIENPQNAVPVNG